MDAWIDVLKWPMKSLEGIAFLEMLVIFAVFLLYRNVKGLRREASEGRKALYEKIDKVKADLQRQFSDELSKLWSVFRDHEESCSLRHQADERWKGQIEAKVDNLEKPKE